MDSRRILCKNNVLLTLLVSLSIIKQCSCLCGDSFSQASAAITIAGLNRNYIAEKCVRNEPIETFKLLSVTEVIKPGTFSNLFRLTSIEMNNVGITKVEPGFLENTPDLKIIKLVQNKLQHIGKYTFDQIILNTLELSSNQITDISDNAFENSSIKFLSLSDNQLGEIYYKWFVNTELTALSITHNLVTRLDAYTFSGIKGLKTINLNYNKIQSINPRTFSSINSLETLYLSGNMLLNANFEIRNKLRNVDLSFNKISYLPMDDFTPLWIMSIYPNPFECVCLRRFWKFISRKGIKLWETKSLRRPWKDEYPLCVAKYDNCDPNVQSYADHADEYFRLVNYDDLGKHNYRKEDEFIDLGIVN